MYTIDIPGQGELQLAHAVFDFNGTLANGGDLLPDLGALTVSCFKFASVCDFNSGFFRLGS